MNNRGYKLGALFSRKSLTMIFAFAAMVLTAIVGSTSVSAWGPNRATFTMDKPSTHVTFDSITDNPDWGDERGFTIIKDVTGQDNSGSVASADGFAETAKAQDGHTYMVKMFVHNNAAANYNLVAKNTRLMTYMPTASGDSAMIQGMIAADNCGADNNGSQGSACQFWDEAYLTGDDGYNFKVSYVANSGRYYNNVKDFKTSGFDLSDSITSEDGAKVGYQSMDGNVQGCFQYSGYATFLITVNTDEPSFTLTKKARVQGSTDWGYNIKAKPGDKIEYQLNYDNVGKTLQSDVVLKDYMPEGLAYQAKSTYLINTTNPRPGLNQADDSWTTKGLNIGGYNPDSNAIVEYSATVPDESDLQCGDNVFENVVMATTDDAGSKLASNKVTVHKDCANGGGDTEKKCQWNDKLVASDEKCVSPGAPAAGLNIGSAIASLAGLLTLVTIAVVVLLRKNIKHGIELFRKK